MTFNIEEGMISRVRVVFRKKTTESDWVTFRTMLMRILGKFPEAKEAVVQGLLELRGIDPAWAT